MMSLSSHVLNTTLGQPARELQLTLTTPDGAVVEAQTDEDGRCNQWQNTVFTAGQYSLRFHVKPYLLAHHKESFYPFVDIHFEMREGQGHYHVPLLISPYSFSTYRGS